MDSGASGRTWDEASSPAATRLARRYETAWRRADGHRPDLSEYLPEEPGDRPAALLALLRTDLSLRFENREPVRVEWYQEQHPQLGSDAVVALLYEEFCLREEAGEEPELAEYQKRFPEVAAQLRRVLDIHHLVGSKGSTSLGAAAPAVPFPEVGQTIAGFHLVEDLGRGAFARVFRALERQLADRPVALKVARGGSREPQTLARLQHTNIVPVHSYRIDPATGLHLLCMPYLGRVTLAQVLANREARSARTGAELVAALEQMQPVEPPGLGRPRAGGVLARGSYAQAVAWWGARLAEALQHAHDRGVLHRDIKPSNVLVTADGMPMLLDFNLARESWVDDPNLAPAAAGGTLAYMAPEHLEALADGVGGNVDARSDLYALGVVLFEALGTRPFSVPAGSISIAEALLRAADERRTDVPSLRESYPDVPPALDAIVQKCLEPDPANRYATAGDLAADLQAVVDDGPLRFAREPQPSRSVRWLRRNRRRLAVAAPLALAAAVLVFTIGKAQVDRVRQQVEDVEAEFRVRQEAQQAYTEGRVAYSQGQFDRAMLQFEFASRLADKWLRGGHKLAAWPEWLGAGLKNADWPEMRDLYAKAREKHVLAQQTRERRADAEKIIKAAGPLRYRLLGFVGEPESASRELVQVLQPFQVLNLRPGEDWTALPELELLDRDQRARLINEVNELLFMWIVNLKPTGEAEVARRAIGVCDRALAFATPRGPWEALRARCVALAQAHGQAAGGVADAPQSAASTLVKDNPAGETSARACYEWGLLRNREGRFDWAIAWLQRATQLEPSNYWYHFYLAYNHQKAGETDRLRNHDDQALQHYSVAVALEPESPFARLNRAMLYRQRGAWSRALEDLQQALRSAGELEFLEARLDRGVLFQDLGDARAARADYEHVIASDADTPLARAARLNCAKLDFDAGQVERALAEYDALLAEDPSDSLARMGRALLSLRGGQPALAEADLTQLLETPGLKAQALALRAQARLALGRALAAEADADAAYQLEASPSHERLWARSQLAAGQWARMRLDDPDEVAAWPSAGAGLEADVRSAAEQLQSRPEQAGLSALQAALARSVLLSGTDHPGALAAADSAVMLEPTSVQARLVRARIRRRAGQFKSAMSDVEQGLKLEPDAPRLLALRGRLNLDMGRPTEALADLDRAIRRGAEGSIHRPRARALLALGRVEESLDDWSRALAFDPEDTRSYLGRAQAFLRLGQFDQALADLEQASGWVTSRQTELLDSIALLYAACLPERPERLPRVLALARRAWASRHARRERPPQPAERVSMP